MSDSYPLPTEPEGVIPSLVERFNSGKIEAMMALYAPEAVFVANDGRTITDRAEFTAILEHDIKLGLPLKANVRHVFVGGDTAQIVLDWSIDGTGPDGKIVHMHGTASDIMRRAHDDAVSGKDSTDKGEATDAVYRRNLRDSTPGSERD